MCSSDLPSFQHAAGFLKPILDKYGDKIRYIRYDLPLINMHPWAFSAAMAGRAIHRQKPELFWDYKEQVYANQDKLNAFTIDDFARHFAQDHDLDLKKYDADVASPELQASILAGAGVAFSNDVRATPTYMVNGATVDPESLQNAGLLDAKSEKYKLLARGSVAKKLTVRAHKFSAKAREAIEGAGGSIEEIAS